MGTLSSKGGVSSEWSNSAPGKLAFHHPGLEHAPGVWLRGQTDPGWSYSGAGDLPRCLAPLSPFPPPGGARNADLTGWLQRASVPLPQPTRGIWKPVRAVPLRARGPAPVWSPFSALVPENLKDCQVLCQWVPRGKERSSLVRRQLCDLRRSISLSVLTVLICTMGRTNTTRLEACWPGLMRQ